MNTAQPATPRHQRTPKRRLVSPDVVEHVECCAPPSGKRAQCVDCSKVINDGAVVVDQNWIDELEADEVGEISSLIQRANEAAGRSGVHYEMRAMYCDGCGHIQVWPEQLDADGLFTGNVLTTGPVLIRGKHRDRFIAAHPEAAGVLMR